MLKIFLKKSKIKKSKDGDFLFFSKNLGLPGQRNPFKFSKLKISVNLGFFPNFINSKKLFRRRSIFQICNNLKLPGQRNLKL